MIINHCEATDRLAPCLQFGATEKIILVELSQYYQNLTIVLDQPRWFMREGLLALNIFVGDFRAYTVAFSLFIGDDDEITAVVGAIQGRNTDNALSLYRDLTKHLHGYRPRDFLFEVFKTFSRGVGVTRILAVGDESRIHRHPYFGDNDKVKTNYNDVWQERGGFINEDGFYELPLVYTAKDLSQIASKKRSKYRKREDLMKHINSVIPEMLTHCKPIEFIDT